MVTFEMFNLSELDKEIFNSVNMEKDSVKLLNFELYKLVPREEIVNKMKDDFPELCIIEEVHSSSDFREIEQKYGILVDQLTAKDIRIVNKLYAEDYDKTSISIALSQYDLEFCEVTELNFLELKGTNLIGMLNIEILLKRLILEAIYLKATDLHFSVEHHASTVEYPVYYRCGGMLNRLSLFELNKDLNKNLIMQFIERKTNSSSLDVTESAGITTSVSNLFKNRNIELRISANAVCDGYRCVIRIQEQTTTSMKIAELGFDQKIMNGLQRLAEKKSGITFITGAIRTGKNTTAFAIANELVKETVSLISYDSPIEVLMPFPQVDYYEDSSRLLDYVRLAKKQDIDIAFLNEIPSKEVAFAVSDLVNSSIGVITTLHLDRLWDLPFKLKEYYGDSYKDIISQVNGVVNQKMFGVPCQNCTEVRKTFDVKSPSIREYLLKNDITEVFVSKGCPQCSDVRTQTSGYVIGKNQPYAEFLVFTDTIKTDLLRCETVWEMSEYLKKAVCDSKQNLEFFMLDAIRRGVLSYEALHYIL